MAKVKKNAAGMAVKKIVKTRPNADVLAATNAEEKQHAAKAYVMMEALDANAATQDTGKNQMTVKTVYF